MLIQELYHNSRGLSRAANLTFSIDHPFPFDFPSRKYKEDEARKRAIA